MNEENDHMTAWTQALEQMELLLAESLSRNPEVLPVAPPGSEETGLLANLDTRLRQWQGCLDDVERQAVAAESDLASDQAAVADWLRRAAQVREKLAEGLRRVA